MAEVLRKESILRRFRWTVLAIVLSVGYLFGVASNALANETVGIDFGVFHAGGSLIKTSGFDAVYDTTTFSSYLTSEYFPSLADSETVSHFISTPTFGWLAQGLAALPFGVAFVVWLVLGALALVPACRILGLARWVPVALLLSPMMSLNTSLGQTGPFVLLLFAILHQQMVERRLVRCGLIAGLLIVKPPLALGYGLLWLVQTRKYLRAMLVAASTGIVISVPTLVGGFGPWTGFLDAMRNRADIESAWSQQSASVPEFLKLALPLAPAWVTLLSWAVGLGAALVLLLAAQRRFGDDVEVMSAAAVVATVVASPHLLVYDSLILLVPVAVAHRRGLLTGDRAGLLATASTASIALDPVVYDLQYNAVGRGIGMEFPALVLCVYLLLRWNKEAAAFEPEGTSRRPADHAAPSAASPAVMNTSSAS